MKTLLLFVLMGICQCGFAVPPESKVKADTFYNNLPLRLVTFSARVVNLNTIQINWVTAETWTNVLYYEVYRSSNNIDYTSIGVVNQISSAPVDQYYKYIDNISNATATTTFYYKLKQVHSNGSISWSYILTIKVASIKNQEITVWPNPVTTEINITFFNPFDNNLVLQYYNSSGIMVLQENISSNKGNNVLKSTAISKLQTGNYFLKITAKNNSIGLKQINKQ